MPPPPRTRGPFARRLSLEALEDRTTPTRLDYTAVGDTPLTVRVAGGAAQVVDSADPARVLAAAPAAGLADGVSVSADGFDVVVTLDATAAAVPGGVYVDGGAGESTLVGPAADVTWAVTGAGAGTVGGFARFAGVETLRGAADNEDTFVLEPGGSVRLVDGADRGFDTLVVNGAYSSVTLGATGKDSGWVDLDGTRVDYAGLEPVNLGGPVTDLTLDLSGLADFGILEDTAPAGQMQLRTATFTAETQLFQAPTGSLTVRLGVGDDTLRIDSLDPSFAASLTVDGQDGVDAVVVNGTIATAGFVDVTAESVTVNAGKSLASTASSVELDATDLAGPGQDVVLQANAAVSAGTTVLIRAGDNVSVPATASVTAGTTATLRGDFDNVGTPGATVDLLGTVAATQVLVHADNNDNVINLDRGQDSTPTAAFANGQRGVVNLRGNTGAVDITSGIGPTVVNVGSGARPPAARGSMTFQPSTRQISGSFAGSGIAAGNTIGVYGTQNNNGTYVVESVSATALTLAPTAVLVNEVAAGASVVNQTANPSTLNPIRGAVRVFGSPNANDTLNLDDSADAADATPAFTGPVSVNGTTPISNPQTPANTVTRSAGSFLADGFAVGQQVTLSGARNNNGLFTITALTATQMTLAGGPLVREAVALPAAVTIRKASGTLTPTAVTGEGMGPAGVEYSALRNLNVYLGTGANSFAVAETAAATKTVVDAGIGAGDDAVGALFAQDLAGDLTVVNAENATARVGRDLAGRLETRVGMGAAGDPRQAPGDLQSALVGRAVAAAGVLRVGRDLGVLQVGSVVNKVPVPGDVAGQVLVGRDLGQGSAFGNVTGLISVGRDIAALLKVTGGLAQSGRVGVARNAAQVSFNGSQSGRMDVGGNATQVEVNGFLNPTGQTNVTGNLTSLLYSRGLNGRVIVGGNLGSLRVFGDVNGNIGVNGDAGRVVSASGSSLTRAGQILVSGNFPGRLAVLGNVYANTWIKGDLTGRWAVKGRPVAGLSDPTRAGILAELRVDGAIGTSAAIAVAGRIGDVLSGGLLRAGSITGILAATGPIEIGNTPTGTAPPPLGGAQLFANATGANAAAINAIFTNGGVPLHIGVDPLGQAYFNLILIGPSSLTVVAGTLFGPIG